MEVASIKKAASVHLGRSKYKVMGKYARGLVRLALGAAAVPSMHTPTRRRVDAAPSDATTKQTPQKYIL